MAQGQEVCRDQSGSQAQSEVATSHYRGQGGSVGTGMSCPVSGYEARGPGLEGHILAVHVAEVFQDLVVSDQGAQRSAAMGTHPLGNKPTGDWGLTPEDLSAEWGAMAAVCANWHRGGSANQLACSAHALEGAGGVNRSFTEASALGLSWESQPQLQ
ncbi:Hypothetical predicted protein [Mytilus galloprovincialis]|uniref:Uncharacterized protein n=1 Tax=Mytilus galloprovincialis TaxID=29158 RepID=A0A8B6FY53_MYTGA|nr:Hypothetical predicted protein [Mytilus galloprovincialis]